MTYNRYRTDVQEDRRHRLRSHMTRFRILGGALSLVQHSLGRKYKCPETTRTCLSQAGASFSGHWHIRISRANGLHRHTHISIHIHACTYLHYAFASSSCSLESKMSPLSTHPGASARRECGRGREEKRDTVAQVESRPHS